MLTQDIQRNLAAHRLAAEQVTSDFHAAHQQALDDHRSQIETAMYEAIERFERSIAEISDDNPLCVDLGRRTADYVAWMRWALGDLPYYAIALGFAPGELPPNLGGCILCYFSGRVFDDFLDRHYLYRGRRYTLLSSLGEDGPPGGQADAVTVMMGVLLLVESLLQLDGVAPSAGRFLRQIIASYRGVVLGTIMDRSGSDSWSPEFYECLIRHKNVDYWLLLYDALDPGHRSPLHPILMSYYALAQKINDLEDYTRDELQGSANIVSVYRHSVAPDKAKVFSFVEQNVGSHLLELWTQSLELPEPARSVLSIKLAETHDNLARLGFLQSAAAKPATGPTRIGLAWFSNLEEFVQRLGLDALELVDCPVCRSSRGTARFRKQGFQFNRCPQCSHLYVSPRLAPRYVAQLAAESIETAYDPFLQSQKIYAEFICHTLRRHSYGQRLLDIGYGEGHLLMAARALGFQVYGIEPSNLVRSHLDEALADRIQHRSLEGEDLPWGAFDHVAMSHVLEHVLDPPTALERVHAALHPGGLLYIAVPDSESLQFKLMGKTWDAVSPIVHCQFFNETSLTHLLQTTGFEPIQRIQPPALQGHRQERWMQLFRRLGGEEAGELAMLARKLSGKTD